MSELEKYVIDQLARSEANTWPEPQPLPDSLPPVPPLDPDLLPERFRPWLTDVAERMNCPLDYLGAPAMVTLSAVVGRQVGIRPQQFDDWLVIPNFWGGIVGPPGAMKSPALSEAKRPLDRLEARAKEDYERELAEAQVEAAVSKQAEKVTAQQIAKALKDGNHQLARDLALAAQEAETPFPERRRYHTQDCTVEKIGELLAANPRGILILRDELIGFMKSMERDGHEGSRAFYLEAWNGNGGFIFDRIGRGTVDIQAACVSILGGIQPGPLRNYIRAAATDGAGADGLLQRFQMIVWPDKPLTWEEVDRWANTEARNAAFEVFDRLDKINAAELGAEDGDPPWFRFSPEAQQIFREWRSRLEHRLRREDHEPAFEALLAKQRSLMPSIALLIHLADFPEGGPVGVEPTLKAVAWVEYLEAHALRIYAPVLDFAYHAARALGERIAAGQLPDPFNARDVYSKHWSGLDREATEAALDVLEDLDWIRSASVDTGGRPRVDYRINPRVAR